MPLVRTTVRNEYKLATPELYNDNEDPKALLDGVAVAGLVGILRQLGDLAEFAAEVFHGLQEQVMNTSSRSHKLMIRAQKIEAAVSPLEKTLLAQRSHLHFAYTSGSQWHAHIQGERNHFICSDLPLFIVDSYEECRGPPRLHLLDKFDTGGPGSCLKRYSDPTFFKRASAGYDEAYAEKFTRDKKARRRKKVKQKKKTWIQNVDGSTHLNHPTSSHSGSRMHYASKNFGGETSPSQTFSTYDAASKFENGNQFNSFDSRTVSGYGECVSSPSYTLKFDGREPEEVFSRLTMNHSDTIDESLYEESRAVADGIQEQTGARSSGVSWDEKIEIVEPIGPHSNSEESLDVPRNIDPDPLEGEATNFKVDYCSNDSTPKSVTGANQLDDIDSETDNFMDALNTIESESETDLECQTKRELEHLSALNIVAVDKSIHELTQHMNSTLSNLNSNVPSHFSTNIASSEDNHDSIPLEPDCFLSEKTSIAKPSSTTSECYVRVPSPCDTGKSSNLESLPSSDVIEDDDITGPNAESISGNLSSSIPTEPIVQSLKSETGLSSPSKSQKSPSGAPGVTGINFWTNGGLLGLQPSKPPDFSALDCVHDDAMVPSSRGNILNGEENALGTNIFQNSKISKQDRSAKCTASFRDDQEDSISIMKSSLRSLQPPTNSINERSTNLHHSFSSNQSHNPFLSENSRMVPGTKKQKNIEVEAAKSLESSSRIFEVGSNLFANGQGKASSFSDDNRLSSSTTGVSERKSVHHAFQTFSGRTFIEQFGSESTFMSPASSPPLEHMKISFQPIDGFEISKLKLKFPNGSESQESSKDVFPTFQLVPEESISLQDVVSDSDDDTFCDSSPHGSDDCLSHYSESDSEEWETRESTRCDDNARYDAFCENSTESVSSNLDTGRIADGLSTNASKHQNLYNETVTEHTQTDLPSFDILSNSFKKDLHDDNETKSQLDSEFSNDPAPPPPPLPPVEWRGMKPDPDMSMDKQIPSFEGSAHEFYKLSTSTISQQPKPAPVNHDNTEAVACTTNRKHPDVQKVNVHKAANQSLNSKVVEEKEDFLQQIRTKSFSLRPTVTERPNLTLGAPANVSVTAILEKANAIRQAVASDDDSWSEE
ncbi:protein SCAR3-like isoform X2 [Apium graveolens]|uniref:protein SCAR3-like isoform X2 n=1 Tax=Apium graveolens TaxID=4045 RepID=UPI003D79F318